MKLFTKKRLTKKIAVAIIATAVAVIAPIAAIAGWGPARPTYTYNGPGTPGADHVVFNSFVNNPNYGDERTFFDGKNAANTGSGGYLDNIPVQAGQEILLRTYVHNNADPSLNASGQGVAQNTRVQIVLPSGTARGVRATSIISANNASPNPVTDTADFNSSNPFSLTYVAGSARAYTNAVPGGYQVNDSIVGGGALVGYDSANGVMPGCFQYAAIVTIRVRVNASTLNFNKQIGIPGSGQWQEQVNANPGDTLSYRLLWQNTGAAALNDVVIRDQLPSQVELIPGSIRLYNEGFPNGYQLDDTSLFTAGGVDVGNYAQGANGYIRFQVRVRQGVFQNCQQYTVANTGFARSDVVTDQVSDQANFLVYINQNCTPSNGGSTPGGSIPRTGIETPIAGALGTTGIGYASYAYLRGKKKFRDALRGLIKK